MRATKPKPMTSSPKKMSAKDERKFRGVAVRTDAENRFEERLDRVAEALSKRVPGLKLKRAAAASAALERGLASLEQELGLEQ